MISIAFDREHERQSEAGVTRSSRALARALIARPDVRLTYVGGGEAPRRGTLEKRLLTLRQDFFWYPFLGRRRARGLDADVYHCPTPRAPLTRGKPPLVVTVHDLASFRFPETLTRWTRFYERATLSAVTRAADRIIAVSEDTASDLQTILGVSASKIRVIHNGVDTTSFGPATSESPLDFRYVLFVGTPQPRKNLSKLAHALELVRSKGENIELVVVGAEGWGELGPIGTRTRFLGRVDDNRLRALYQHAECLAIVSLHEGFGLPAIEAMSCGTPVVASNVGALPEITGNASVLVDPLDIDSIAAGILEATGPRRASLIDAGSKRASAFTWEKAAEQTVNVYKELI